MGITENYRFSKRDCAVCQGEGVVEVPAEMDPLDYCVCYAGVPIASDIETVEEICPVCDGKGWYYYEEED